MLPSRESTLVSAVRRIRFPHAATLLAVSAAAALEGLLVAPPASLLASPSAPALQLPVDASVLKGAEFVRWRDGRGTTVAPATVIAIGPNESAVRVGDCRVNEIYVVRTGRLISTPFRPVRPADCDLQNVNLRLFKRSDLGGLIHGPGPALTGAIMKTRECGTTVPKGVEWEISDAYPLELQGDGRWKTALPATCLDMALSVPGFDSVVWKKLELPAGGYISVGEVRLQTFGSFTVSVKTGEPERPIAGAAVSVIAEDDFDAAVRSLYQGRYTPALARAVTDTLGNATLRATPGLVHVCVEAAGFSPSCSETGVIAPGEQTPFPPFILTRPGRLSVALDATMVPHEPPWDNLRFSAVASASVSGRWVMTSFTASVQPGEEVEFPPLPAGRWSIDLQISGEEVSALLMAQAEAVVRPDEHDHVWLSLANALVSGRVRLRGRPVEGRLLFVQRGATGMDQVRTTSGKNGEFVVVLPERGQYQLEVFDSTGKPVAIVPVLAVDSPRLDINLPAASVTGLVIDSSGSPVPEAAVTLQAIAIEDRDDPAAIQHGVRTDAAGTFRIDSVPVGEWKLSARSGRRMSAPVSVRTADSTDARFTLALKEATTVECRVMTDQGQGIPGVAGFGIVEAVDPRDLGETMVQFQTGPRGDFRVNVPEVTGRVLNAQLLGPLFGGAAVLFPLDGPCEVHVPTTPGRLMLRLAADVRGQGGLALMTDDGAILGISTLLVGGAATSGRAGVEKIIDIPRLAPGRWHVFRISPGQYISRLRFGRPADYVPLGDADVTAGNTTVLRVER